MKLSRYMDKGLKGRLSRYMLKRSVRRRLHRMANFQRGLFKVGLGVATVALVVGAGAWILGKSGAPNRLHQRMQDSSLDANAATEQADSPYSIPMS